MIYFKGSLRTLRKYRLGYIKASQSGRKCQSSGHVAQLIESILGHKASWFTISTVICTTSITNLKNWPSEQSAIQGF